MGWEAFLTRRADDPDADGGPEIPLAAWHAVVDADPELERLRANDARIIGTQIELWYRGDRIGIGHPSWRGMRKLTALAVRLGAHVTDDDGNLHAEADYAGPPPKRRWWHFWRDDDADTRT